MKEKKGSEKKSLSKKKILTGWVILWYLWKSENNICKKREMKKNVSGIKRKKLKWEKIVTGAVITLWLCCSGQERWKWFSCPRNVLFGTVPISSVTMAMAINWLLEAIEASIPAADKLGKDLSYFPRPLYPPPPHGCRCNIRGNEQNFCHDQPSPLPSAKPCENFF